MRCERCCDPHLSVRDLLLQSLMSSLANTVTRRRLRIDLYISKPTVSGGRAGIGLWGPGHFSGSLSYIHKLEYRAYGKSPNLHIKVRLMHIIGTGKLSFDRSGR